MNRKTCAPHDVGAVDLEGIPTMDLMTELARRERIAMLSMIKEITNQMSDARDSSRARNEGDEGSAKANRA